MAEPFLAEIRLFSFGFPPRGWAHCNGQLLQINQNQALFSLLGTTYGGDGRVNFALPDLRGRTPIHADNGFPLGVRGGEEAHSLSTAEIPSHVHQVKATSQTPAANIQTGALLAPAGGGRRPVTPYAAPNNLVPLVAGTVANAGVQQPHQNMQPSMAIGFCIALQGIFPSQS